MTLSAAHVKSCVLCQPATRHKDSSRKRIIHKGLKIGCNKEGRIPTIRAMGSEPAPTAGLAIFMMFTWTHRDPTTVGKRIIRTKEHMKITLSSVSIVFANYYSDYWSTGIDHHHHHPSLFWFLGYTLKLVSWFLALTMLSTMAHQPSAYLVGSMPWGAVPCPRKTLLRAGCWSVTVAYCSLVVTCYLLLVACCWLLVVVCWLFLLVAGCCLLLVVSAILLLL